MKGDNDVIVRGSEKDPKHCMSTQLLCDIELGHTLPNAPLPY